MVITTKLIMLNKILKRLSSYEKYIYGIQNEGFHLKIKN